MVATAAAIAAFATAAVIFHDVVFCDFLHDTVNGEAEFFGKDVCGSRCAEVVKTDGKTVVTDETVPAEG